jgi:hypothetical protein
MMNQQQMGGQQLPPDFKLTDAREMLCECGNNTFMDGVRFRKVSRLLTGNSIDSVIPVQVFLCTACGKAFNEMLPQELQETKIVK